MSRELDLRALLGDPDSPPAHPPWHGAPAVITDCPHCPEIVGPTVQVDLVGRGWTCSHCGNFTDWNANVTPLYPREDARPLPTREQIADAIWGTLDEVTGEYYPYDQADAVLALLKEQDA